MCTYCITPLIQHACYMRYQHACYSNTRTTCTLHACYMRYQHACYSTLVQHAWYMRYHFQHPYNMHVTLMQQECYMHVDHNMHVIGCNMHVTCTLFRIGKRVLVAQIMIFRYRRFSATTPKNNSRDKTFVFVSEVSPTLCLHSR